MKLESESVIQISSVVAHIRDARLNLIRCPEFYPDGEIKDIFNLLGAAYDKIQTFDLKNNTDFSAIFHQRSKNAIHS